MPAQQLVDHHPHTVSRELGSNSGEQAPGTFRVVFGQVQLLLQLGIHRFADEPQPIELLLRLLGTDRLLIELDRGEQLHRAILLQEGLEGRIIVGSVSKQTLEVMRKRVKQFHYCLVIVVTGSREPKKVSFSWFADEYLIDGTRCHIAIGEAWGWTWPV